MNNLNKTRIIWVLVLLLLGGFALVEVKTHFVQRWIADVVYDNRVPYLKCEEIPDLTDIEKIMEERQDIIQQIEDMNPGNIRAFIDSSDTCSGKYILIIEYPSHANRTQIEALIGETFFGIPWKGLNI